MPAALSEQSPQTSSLRSPLVREVLIAAIVVFIAVLLRAPALGQSLWYDELVTLANFVGRPWSAIVRGEYSPNGTPASAIASRATPRTCASFSAVFTFWE